MKKPLWGIQNAKLKIQKNNS